MFLPGESQDRGAWWATIYGVAQSRTRLKWLSSSSSTLSLGQIPKSRNTSSENKCMCDFHRYSQVPLHRNKTNLQKIPTSNSWESLFPHSLANRLRGQTFCLSSICWVRNRISMSFNWHFSYCRQGWESFHIGKAHLDFTLCDFSPVHVSIDLLNFFNLDVTFISRIITLCL